jgi:hypothetical protein
MSAEKTDKKKKSPAEAQKIADFIKAIDGQVMDGEIQEFKDSRLYDTDPSVLDHALVFLAVRVGRTQVHKGKTIQHYNVMARRDSMSGEEITIDASHGWVGLLAQLLAENKRPVRALIHENKEAKQGDARYLLRPAMK